jgi:hypothetical protein
MQIIISPVNGSDNFLLDGDVGWDVSDLRSAVAQKLAATTESIKVGIIMHAVESVIFCCIFVIAQVNAIGVCLANEVCGFAETLA